jgi:hypothetical protein
MEEARGIFGVFGAFWGEKNLGGRAAVDLDYHSCQQKKSPFAFADVES